MQNDEIKYSNIFNMLKKISVFETKNSNKLRKIHFQISAILCFIISFQLGSDLIGQENGKQLIVWDGEQFQKGAGWTNPAKTCTILPQTKEVYSGKLALEFKFNDTITAGWIGAGWNWAAMQVGPYGTDISTLKYFTFWLKVKGNAADFAFNLLCNGEPALDQPQHHTEKVIVAKYCPQWKDGNWHKIVVPLNELIQPKGFDPKHVAEMQFFNTKNGTGSFFIDDIAFN